MTSVDPLPPETNPQDYLPARMVNEFVYCPRLFYLMHVEGQFADSFDTIDGAIVHRRVDAGKGGLPVAEANVPSDDLPPDAVTDPDPAAKAKPRAKRKHIQKATLFQDEPTDASGLTPESANTLNDGPVGDDAPCDDDGKIIHTRSVTLSDDTLGVIAKMDLIQSDGRVAVPVDYKRGHPKTGIDGQLDAWPPEKVQIALQVMVLRASGYKCNEGVLYFNESRQRVRIPVDDELTRLTHNAVSGARAVRDAGVIPQPLSDSPKCARCSLVNICLPDETLATIAKSNKDCKHDGTVRPMVTARDQRRPLYLNTQGMWVGKKGDVLVAKVDGKVMQEVRLREINQLNLFGNVQLSTQLIQAAAHLNIPIAYYTQKGWYHSTTHPLGVKNVLVRREQFRRADDPAFCLNLAKVLVQGKIRNSRTLLMRNHVEPATATLRDLKRDAAHSLKADSLASLLGIEGTAARRYFQDFAGMIKVNADVETMPGGSLSERRAAFDFRGRNRRPPRDPVNALLSLAYALLTKDCMIAATSVGLDPYLGFYHQIKPGKPALALDIMEPFRPLVADSAVISAINNRMVTPSHFTVAGPSVVLSDTGRKHFLLAYEHRMDTMVTHPAFGYRVSYRRLLEIQTRLLARHLTGEIPTHEAFVTR